MILDNKTAIVTGGARGIGKEVAKLLVKEGANVVIVARTESEVNDTVRELGEDKVIGIRADVSQRKDAQKIVAETLSKFKTVDILVNVAGVQAPIGPFYKNEMEEWVRNLEINLLGTVFMCREVLSVMLKNKNGSIVNFSGGGAASLRPNFSAYSVSKAGVVRFTEILADELRNLGIRVNAVAPGAVNTKMTEEIKEAGDLAGKEADEAKERLEKNGDDARLAAELILFLVSDKSGSLTGRLISAKWDNWQEWSDKDIQKIMAEDKYTLRRIK